MNYGNVRSIPVFCFFTELKHCCSWTNKPSATEKALKSGIQAQNVLERLWHKEYTVSKQIG
jgi:hypothetical protein